MKVVGRLARVLIALLPLLLLYNLSREADAADSFGQSLLFSSTDFGGGNVQYGHVAVAHAGDLNMSTQMTIEAWVKVNNPSACPTILSKDYAAGSYWFGICNFDGGGTNRLAFNSNGTFAAVYGATAIPQDVWTHVAVTWSAGVETRFYINGDLDAVRTAGPSPVPNDRPLWIGKSPNAAEFPFRGYLAEVRIWRVARSQNDIREMLHVATQEKLPFLVANWNLAGDLEDVVGGHHGTAQGGASSPSFQPGAPPPRPMLVPIDTEFLADTTGPSMAVVFGGRAAVPEMNRLILAGGTVGGAASDRVVSVDGGSGKATTLAGKLPTVRTSMSAAYSPERGLVYLFGGNSGGFNLESDGVVLAVNPADGTTRVVNATLRANNSAAVYHAPTGKIWIFGGWHGGEGFTPTGLTTIWMFDPATETVTTASFALPAPNNSQTIAASRLTGKIYLTGGGVLASPGTTAAITEVTVNADGSGSMRTLTSQLPASDIYKSMVEDPVSGMLYLLGGWSTFASNRVVAFDPVAERAWETPILQPEPREQAAAIYDPKARHALLVGGASGGTPRNTIWRIPLGDGPAVPVGRWDFVTNITTQIGSIHGSGNRVAMGGGPKYYLWDENKGLRIEDTSNNQVKWDPVLRRLWALRSDRADWIEFSPEGFASFGAVVPPPYGNGFDGLQSFDIAPVGFAAPGVRSTKAFQPIFGAYLKGGFGEPYTYDARIVMSLFADAFGQTGQYWYETGQTGINFLISAITHQDFNTAWYTQRNNPGDEERLRILSYYGYLRPGGAGDAKPSTADYGQACGVGANAMDIVQSMTFGPNNDLWIVAVGSATNANFPNSQAGGGICRVLNLPGAAQFQMIDPSAKPRAYQVSVDRDGRVWVVRDHSSLLPGGGISVFQSVPSTGELRTGDFNWLNAPVGSNVFKTTSGGWVSPYRSVGAVDERVWFGSPSGLLATVAQRWAQVDRANSIRDKTIEKIFLARGRAFMADANNLYILQPDGVSWDNRSGIHARALIGDRRGRIWVGTDGDVRRYTPTGWDLLPDTPGTAPTGPTRALAEDANGRIWIGGDAGLTLFDRERFVATFTAANSALPATTVKALLVDRDDRLWVGTTAGLARFDGTTFTVFTTANGLQSNDIADLALLGDGRVAASNANGTAIFNGTSFVVEGVAPNLPLDVDQLGRLWLGAFNKIPTGYMNYYWTNSGLRHSTISDVAADKADRVWFAHAPNTGVSLRATYLAPLPEVIPTINSISPDSGANGQVVTIAGTGFGTNPSELEVRIGSQILPINSVSPNAIVVTIGPDVTSGDVVVKRLRRSSSLSPGTRPAFCAIPTISAYTPTGGNLYVEMAVAGANFDPTAQIALGGALRNVSTSPRRVTTRIQPGDASGNIRIRNTTPGCPGHEATAGNFRVVELQLQAIDINQGLPSLPLVDGKPSLLRSYISSPNRRPSDVVRIGSIDVIQRNPATGEASTPYVLTIPNGTTVTPTLGAPSAADLINVSLSFNVPFFPNAWAEKRVVLKNGPYTLAERTQTFNFLSSDQHTLLMVPIVPPTLSMADRRAFEATVDANLDQVRRRMMPFGYLNTTWTNYYLERTNPVNIGDNSEAGQKDFEKINRDLDFIRKVWHSHVGGSGAYVVGFVHPSLATPNDAAAGASWVPEDDEFDRDWAETWCDIGSAVGNALTLGLADLGDDCDMDLPRTTFVSGVWHGFGLDASGIPTSTVSRIVGHELGHSLGLVADGAPNYATDLTAPGQGNHSMFDELNGGACGASGTTYNHQLTLYNNGLTVREPVVNPLNPVTLTQLFPNASLPGIASQNVVTRAKAILSYACARRDMNLFFDPSDFFAARAKYLAFPDAGRPGTAAPLSSGTLDSHVTIRPRTILGERISVSGVITPDVEAGRIMEVRALGPDASLSPGYTSEYTLAQVDAAGNVLTEIGFLRRSYHIHDVPLPAGQRPREMFSATIVRAQGVAAIQLRKDGRVLASYTAGGALPTISLSSPNGGSFTSGDLPVTWAASDPDNDPLTVMIEYSRDGINWELHGIGEASGTLNIPLARLGGSNSAVIRATVSDGFRSATATSTPFSVGNQAPLPFINAINGALESRPVELTGGARDLQDGIIPPSGLRWTSSRDGVLGTGGRVVPTLSAGRHTITLEATNSAGLKATATAVVLVGGDYDGDGIADQDDLSKGLGLSPLDGADVFRDAGGLPLIVKLERGLDPTKTDTDGDGRSDAQELVDGSDPKAADAAPPSSNVLTAAPATLNFSYNHANPTAPPLGLVSLSSQKAVDWAVTASANWLYAPRAAGRTLDAAQIAIDARTLAPGSYTGTLTFSSAELGTSTTVTVNLTVTGTPGTPSGPGPVPPSYFYMPGLPLRIPAD
ncbi:MAG: LamG-like jellyroll fold domain-containing protein [Dehalococcoidia bacterium]